MAKPFGIITAIALVLAIFVSYKNKEKYTAEIAETTQQKSNLKASEARLELAKTHRDETIAKRKGLEDENVQLGEQEFAQNKTNDELKSQSTAKTNTIGENKVKLDAIREKTSKIGDINALASKMRTLKGEIEDLTQNITSHEAKLANLNSENTRLEGQVKALNEKNAIISENRSLPTMKTQIRSIYPSWGFVTLGSGNSEGVVTGSTLAVVRDNATVAKLLVTSVERNSAAASIVPDSLAQDTTLMIGDRVIPAEKAPSQAVSF